MLGTYRRRALPFPRHAPILRQKGKGKKEEDKTGWVKKGHFSKPGKVQVAGEPAVNERGCNSIPLERHVHGLVE